MRRSQAVRLTLAASASSAAAVGAAGCAGPASTPAEALHCVEGGSNRVVADSLCGAARLAEGGRSGAFGAPGGSSGDFGTPDSGGARGAVGHAVGHTGSYASGPHFVPSFLWYYGGRVASGYASAGRYDPADGVRYRSSTGYAATGGRRGGFFSRAFGGGRGGAGGAREGSAGRGSVSRGGFGSFGAAHGGGGA